MEVTDQIEITKWERAHSEEITGWEVHYGTEENKVWIFYEGYSIIIYKMKDRTTKEFKRQRP